MATQTKVEMLLDAIKATGIGLSVHQSLSVHLALKSFYMLGPAFITNYRKDGSRCTYQVHWEHVIPVTEDEYFEHLEKVDALETETDFIELLCIHGMAIGDPKPKVHFYPVYAQVNDDDEDTPG